MAELDGRSPDPAELQALALTNYGHFTTMRVEEGRVRGLALHLERLERDCHALFGVGLDLEQVRAYARRALPPSGAVVVRVTVFDPALDVGTIAAPAEPRILVTTRPAGSMTLGPMRARTVHYVRDLPSVKSVGLFGALRHRREAQLAGYDDALFLDSTGAISEGGTWNIGFVRDGRVVWPEAAYLAGTAMQVLQAEAGGTTQAVRSLDGFEAAFATNAAFGVRPISTVDSATLVEAHPVVERLRAAYAAQQGELL